MTDGVEWVDEVPHPSGARPSTDGPRRYVILTVLARDGVHVPYKVLVGVTFDMDPLHAWNLDRTMSAHGGFAGFLVEEVEP